MALYVMSCLSYQLVDRLLYSFYVSTCFFVCFFFFCFFFFFLFFFVLFFLLFFFLFVCSTYFFKYKQAKINCLNGILWNLARRADGVCEASYGSP